MSKSKFDNLTELFGEAGFKIVGYSDDHYNNTKPFSHAINLRILKDQTTEANSEFDKVPSLLNKAGYEIIGLNDENYREERDPHTFYSSPAAISLRIVSM